MDVRKLHKGPKRAFGAQVDEFSRGNRQIGFFDRAFSNRQQNYYAATVSVIVYMYVCMYVYTYVYECIHTVIRNKIIILTP